MRELDDALRMHALDLRGHGSSPWRQPYDLAAYLDDVIKYIREEIGRSTVLSGHSLGGLISAGIAARQPDLVDAVIFEDPPFYTAQLPVLKRSPLYEIFQSVRGLLVKHHDNEGELRDLMRLVEPWRAGGPDSPTLTEAYGESYVRQLALDLHRTDPRTLDPVLDGSLFGEFEPEATLSEITCPVLLIAGSSSRGGVLREQDIDRIESLVAGIEIIKLPDSGHDIHTIRPGWFAEVLRDFLAANKMLG
jgi:pimeloyl-ACP methyl ester carboxylesterase